VECRLVQEGEQWRLEANIVDVGNDRSEPLVTLEIGESGPTGTLNSVSRAVMANLGMSELSSALPVGRYPNHARSLDAYLRADQALRSGTAESSRRA
ncbi:MAG: hypothetical protein GWM87_11105, partial [Xanthomonadales bacterium]|nr:hypothetical protein [Xanthomonadales bacterium]NIX13425.1 hypothetical protein [Xanthomonadales bacterium]